jgi:hypothetical protein
MGKVPMNMRSTLILLVNQIKSEFYKSTLICLSDPDSEPDVQESYCNYAPPERAVQAVLNYAKSLEVADTESVGKVEWILN